MPVTIVTGFLGAGKTTLIRHLLENAGGRRLALIVNEFGDVGVDGDLSKAAASRPARRRPSSSSPTAASAARSPTISSRRSTALLAREPTARAHRHRDLGPGAAEAAGQGLRLAGDALAAHGRRRRRGGRRRGRRRGTLRRRSRRGRRQQRRPTPRSTTTTRSRRSTRTSCCAPISSCSTRPISSARTGSTPCAARSPRALPRAVKIVATREGRVDADVLLGLGAGAEDDLARPPLASRRRGRARSRRFRHLRRRRSPPSRDPDALVERLSRSTRAPRRPAHEGLRRRRGQADAAAGAGGRSALPPRVRPRPGASDEPRAAVSW